jgi:hypothetical protein
MPVTAHTHIHPVHGRRLRTAAAVAAVVAALALAGVLALALSGGTSPTATAPAPRATTQELGGPGVGPMGIRYDGGPEEGSWRVTAPNPGRPDGGPDEGTRGPGH